MIAKTVALDEPLIVESQGVARAKRTRWDLALPLHARRSATPFSQRHDEESLPRRNMIPSARRFDRENGATMKHLRYQVGRMCTGSMRRILKSPRRRRKLVSPTSRDGRIGLRYELSSPPVSTSTWRSPWRHRAALGGAWDDVEMAAILLRAGARIDAANDFGVTPLLLASGNGRPAMIALLLEAGADPNLAAASGEVPLMTAARAGSLEVIDALLDRGAR